jgi:hypothetical protein
MVTSQLRIDPKDLPAVAFRSAKVAMFSRYFRGAKGDNSANRHFPQQKLIFPKWPILLLTGYV